jgi:hypothetical protein
MLYKVTTAYYKINNYDKSGTINWKEKILFV